IVNFDDNILTLIDLNNTIKQNTSDTGDLIITAILRPNYYLTFNGESKLIPDYIFENYIEVIQNFNANNESNNYELLKPSIINVINLFKTTVNLLPTYGNYVGQNNNISSNLSLHINNTSINHNDAISSIFYYVF